MRKMVLGCFFDSHLSNEEQDLQQILVKSSPPKGYVFNQKTKTWLHFSKNFHNKDEETLNIYRFEREK